jgi:polar amino acid transport system ATP-binding protein
MPDCMPETDVPKVELRALSKSFGSVRVLDRVSLTVRAGETAAIIGPSGGGKSTMLRCVNRLVEPDGGEVLISGVPFRNASARQVNRQRARMPMVFQRFNLFQNRTALGNVVEAQMVVLKRSRAEAEQKARRVLRRVGLAHKLDAYPQRLSGGEQQRVAIARALAMDPEIILFDEPTSALDPELVGEVLTIMADLAAEGMTMLVVTHEMSFARRSADRVYFFSGGRIVEEGPPDRIFDAPVETLTKSFVRHIAQGAAT